MIAGRPSLTAAILLLGVALAAGCSNDRSEVPRKVEAQPGVGASIGLASCADWRKATVVQRRATVRQLRNFAGGPSGSPPVHGTVLEDGKAYSLFQNYCANDFARGFKLYKLYTRASAFTAR